MRLRRPARWRTAVLAALLGTGFAADAAGLQVSPTTLTLQARQSADGLWLSNTGDAMLNAQVRVFRWVQDNGEERFEPTQDLALSPPMLALAPGGRQLVRVIRLGAPPQAAETSYRVIVDELPLPGEVASRGLQFVLRYSLPVFLAPAGETVPKPVLQARLLTQGDQPQLEVVNSGNQHAQLADLGFIDPAGQRHVLASGLLGYVLPGQRMRWPLSVPASLLQAGGLQLGTFKARINGEPEEQALPLDSPAR